MKLVHWNKTESDCGIVAVTNAAAWCNIDANYEKVEKVAKSCGYGKSGVYHFQFIHLIKKLKIPAKRFRPKTLQDLEKQLYKGKLFILFYTPSDVLKGSGHVITAFVDHTGSIRIVNPGETRNTWRRFVNDLRENGVKNFAAWQVPQRQVK